jgi:hypothetical protein
MGFALAAAPILGAVGAATSAIGAIGGGESAAAQANYEAQVAANNAKIAQQNANYALAAGQTQATNVGLQQRAQGGQITSGIAANNIDVNTGSAKAVRESQAEIGTENVQQTLANAGLTAYGYRTQATSSTAESQLEAAEAPRDVLGGALTGLGTLASGASNLSFKWAGLGTSAALPSPGVGTGGLY